MKKLIKIFRLTAIGVAWTTLYAYVVSLLMRYFWHFEFLNPRYWKIINKFWQNGGIIDTTSEYMFIFTIILIIPLWVLGWKKAIKLDYIKVIFFPVFWYNSYINKKYDQAPSRVVLKNMGSGKNKKQSPQQMMEEMIASRMPSATNKKDLNSNKIRSNLEEKSRVFLDKIKPDGNQLCKTLC